MERDGARMEEILGLMADPDFYIKEDAATDVIKEHGELKARMEADEVAWLDLSEEMERILSEVGA